MSPEQWLAEGGQIREGQMALPPVEVTAPRPTEEEQIAFEQEQVAAAPIYPMSPEEWLASQQPPETTLTGLAGALTRGLAPVAAGAAAGAALGAPIGGVGAITGAVAGAGAAGLATLVGDPIVSTVNNLLGTQYTMPSDAMTDLLTRVGVAEPRTAAERIVETTAAGAGLAGGSVALGRAIETAAGAAPVAAGVGRMLSAQPVAQTVSGGAAGLAGQTAAEMGAGPVGQIAATVAGGLSPLVVPRRMPAPQRMPEAMPPSDIAPPPAEIAPPPAAAAEVAADTASVLNLARQAAGFGPGSGSAKAKLIDMAQINPEAKAAAERLGIDVPFDVLSDNPQVRSAVGLTRALVAGEAEAAWEATVRQVIQRADEISQQFDAAFVAGRPSTGVASQKILDNLKLQQKQLADEAETIYNRIDESIPKSSQVELTNLRNTLNEVMREVGEKGMSAQERNLLKLIDEGEVTYGRLLREKNLIGKAQAGQQSEYGNMAAGDLKRLYGALAQDQLDNVAQIAGEEARRELRAANLLTAKKKALEKRIVAAFGKDIDGSLATLMQSALTSASKGDVAQFNKLLKSVPQELQKETIATAMAAVTAGRAAGRAADQAEQVFSPTNFTKVYRGLRANAPMYAQMVKVMGKEWDVAMRDLYEISRRVSDAQARIPVTGKANQILGEMAVEGLIGKVMSASLSQRLATGAVSTIPGGGLIAPDIVQWMSGSKGAAVQKAAKLFTSPEFQKLAMESATRSGQPTQQALRQAATSRAFNEFARSAKLPQSLAGRIEWLQSAIQTQRQLSQENK